MSEPKARPEIVCLCGSSRFVSEMAVMAWEFEKDGKIALSLHLLPSNYPGVHPDHQAEAEGIAAAMDELHLRKIDLADRVFIANVGGYIGESTAREIEYARAHGKTVVYLEPDSANPRTVAAALAVAKTSPALPDLKEVATWEPDSIGSLIGSMLNIESGDLVDWIIEMIEARDAGRKEEIEKLVSEAEAALIFINARMGSKSMKSAALAAALAPFREQDERALQRSLDDERQTSDRCHHGVPWAAPCQSCGRIVTPEDEEARKRLREFKARRGPPPGPPNPPRPERKRDHG